MLDGEPDEAALAFRPALESLASVRDQVNLPTALATGAAIAAARGDAERAGTLWGAVETVGAREPKPTTERALREYWPQVERVRGAEFERGRAYGRILSLDEAVDYALADA